MQRAIAAPMFPRPINAAFIFAPCSRRESHIYDLPTPKNSIDDNRPLIPPDAPDDILQPARFVHSRRFCAMSALPPNVLQNVAIAAAGSAFEFFVILCSFSKKELDHRTGLDRC